MMQVHTHRNYQNPVDGTPEGGIALAPGIKISWQNGPLGRDEDRKEPSGAFVETVIAIAKERLEFYQSTRFASPYNARAITALEDALASLNARTQEREVREVEGTHVE